METLKNEAGGGYRLDYLEFNSWGTFDGPTSRITPGCHSSLMTGANGSGKTTIVDALLTLLVPNQKRFYNQSSGAEQKKDRSEESYVLGEVGKNRDDDDHESRKSYLRPDKALAVSFLLGCFHNPETNGYVTLVQVRWFSATELKRTYIVSPHKLSVDTDILPFDKAGNWRKRLKNNFDKTEITDSFSRYSQEFIRLFNMRSDKALTLFNQTVGIKVLGNLNDFIRVHMLEDGVQEEEFQKLRANYLDLLDTYTSLQKAEEQIRLLTPVMENWAEYQTLQKDINSLNDVKSTIPYYFAEKEVSVLQQLVADTKGSLREQEELVERKEKEKTEQEREQNTLQSAIDNNEASKAIGKLEDRIHTVKEQLGRKHKKAEEYNVVANGLHYTKIDSLSTFANNRKRAQADLLATETELEQNRDEEIKQFILLQETGREIAAIEAELQSLKGRKNRIPRQNIELRRRMLDTLGLDTEDIPFVGELIQVKEEEKRWESAIERLIRNFALRLLVPERYLRDVNTYVHQTALQGKIVYDKIGFSSKPKHSSIYYDQDALRDKIKIKEGIPIFEPWLELEFAEHLNHICAETPEEFNAARKALMMSGLSKNGDRHEKDDRLNRVTPDQFILGWDNKEQIRLLEIKLEKEEKKKEDITAEIERLKLKFAGLDKKKEAIQKLLFFDNYEELNWPEDESSIRELTEKKEKLSRDSGLAGLIGQLEDTRHSIKILNETIKEETRKSGKLEEKINSYQEKIEDLTILFESENYNDAKKHYELVRQYLKEFPAADAYKKVEAEKRLTQEAVDMNLKEKNKELSNVKAKIIRFMSAFTNPSEDIRQKYTDWSGDTSNLLPDIEYADDFVRLHERIVREDLPRHKETFKAYMKDSVTSRITSFKTGLDNRLEEIEEHIEQLNASLQRINYNRSPDTYIQLRSKQTKDLEVRTFRKELNDCIVPAADIALSQNDDWIEKAFGNIRMLIEQLHNDREKRKRVIDVRNWLDFEAEEFCREDNKRRKTLDSSDSLSGGEKAQFTYTVLGAAIAFQFGISESNAKTNSFRFIAVDEAFSKLDPDKSHYLMELCHQLQLQLLVVTPFDKIHVAEEYISSCHFVKKGSTDRSKVYNLTMQQYREEKRLWEEKMQA